MSTYTAQTYSIDTILRMKQVYTDMPYPGFNLFDLCRKKSAAGVQRLTKGENAWTAVKPKTSDEVLIKAIRGLLNKLTPEKYDDVFGSADLDMLLEESAIESVIEQIFQKALQEPAYSKTYSRFCHDVAMYEVNVSPASPVDGPKSRRSEFRNKIVSRAQREFETVAVNEEGLDKKALELAHAAQAKRKRANIKFVGQLYLQRVISQRTMHMIIRGIFHTDDKKPSEIDIEVLTELLETIGKTIDETQEGRIAMDDHFEELKDLLRRIKMQPPAIKIGPRIRFRIIDTLELRDNAWVPRVHNKSNITPATFSEQQRQLTTPNSTGLGRASPTASTPSSRRGGARFPESPAPAKNANPAWRGEMPTSVTGGSNQTTPSSAAATNMFAARTSPQPEGAAPAFPSSSTGFNVAKPSQKLSDRIQAGRREWKDNGQQLDFDSYTTTLCGYDGVNEDNVKEVTAHEIIREACTTSRADAQDEACKFLIAGLCVGKIPLVSTFAGIIQQAIEDDTAGDAPLFYSRIVKIMKTCSGSSENVDLYRDAIIATFHAFDQLAAADATSAASSAPSSPNQATGQQGFPTPNGSSGALDMTEDYIEEILKVWRLLPQSELDGAAVVSSVFESRGTNNTTIKLVVAILDHLITAKLAEAEGVKSWTCSSKADGAPELKKALTEKFSL